MAEGEPKKAASIRVTPCPFVKEVMFENVTIITNKKISRKSPEIYFSLRLKITLDENF